MQRNPRQGRQERKDPAKSLHLSWPEPVEQAHEEARVLGEMERVVPWGELVALIEPHYPKGKTGRPPFGIAVMRRQFHKYGHVYA